MPEYGTDPHKLHRAEALDTSVEAAHAVDTTHLEKLVHETIKSFGAHGCIQDDVLRKLYGYPYSSVTARFSALIAKNLIKRTGDKRQGRSGRGQSVMVAL